MIDRKRAPPWYRTFASDDLASSQYYGLTAGERGLLDSMARAYWIEGPLPATPRLLAAIVRLTEAEVTANLSAAVLSHFVKKGGLIHRELSRQRAQSDAARDAMAEGGRRGGLASTARRANTTPNDAQMDAEPDFEAGDRVGEAVETQHESAEATLGGTLKPLEMKCYDLKCNEVLPQPQSLKRAQSFSTTEYPREDVQNGVGAKRLPPDHRGPQFALAMKKAETAIARRARLAAARRGRLDERSPS